MKDKLYWVAYNQKRKAYLTLKKRESRERAKSALSTTSPEDLRVVDLNHKPTEVLKVGRVVDRKVVDQKAKEVVDLTKVVDIKYKVADWAVVDQPTPVVDHNSSLVVDQVVDPTLTSLIQAWKTQTNYNCTFGCNQAKYCSNCWYFTQDQLVDYKEESM